MDSGAAILQKVQNDHFNKIAYIEEMGKRNSQKAADPVKGERFAEQERRLIESGELLHHNIKGLSRSLEGDKLMTMVRESSGIREKNLE